MATPQPSSTSPSTPPHRRRGPASPSGTNDVVEEHLGEALVAVEPAEAAHRDALGVEGHQEVGEPAVALGLGVGAEQSEQVGAERAPGGPGLLAGQSPATRLRRRAPLAR